MSELIIMLKARTLAKSLLILKNDLPLCEALPLLLFLILGASLFDLSCHFKFV